MEVVSLTQFDDLPEVADLEDMRRVHRTAGLYFVSRNGVAHTELDCMHLDGVELVANPRWRAASDTECRALGISWCETCCSV